MNPVIGIDLGTTNSVVATVENGSPVVIMGRSGYKLTPSVVAIAKTGKRLVGNFAKRQAVTNPAQTVFAAKRLIGRKWSAPQSVEARKRMLYTLVEGPHDDIRIRLSEKEYSIPEISAMILTELKTDAEAFFGCAVTQAVITVPAYFNDAQRQATKDAGRIAGLDVLRIINEPTAAALAYGTGRPVGKKVVVFDLGGGTLDVSILDIANSVFDVVATNGDTFLGGEDFDARIIDWAADAFQKTSKVDLRQDKMALQRLKDAAEAAKCELSSTTQSEMNLPFIISGPQGALHLNTVLTREQFESLTEDLVKRCVDMCSKTLKEAGLKANQVDEVLLVGGQSRMPAVQEAIAKLFGREPSKGVHPEEVVALGAAIQARSLMNEEKTEVEQDLPSLPNMLLLDVTPHSLGMAIAGGLFQVLIPKNTTVPTNARHLFTTVKDFQTTVRITVLQGEEPVAARNELLGEFMLTGLRPAARGTLSIEVVFDISADGIVSVSARDVDTGTRQSITVTSTSGLSEEEVRKMTEQNSDYLLAVKNDQRFDELRAEVEPMLKESDSLATQFRNAVAGSDYGLDIAEKAGRATETARAAIKARDYNQLSASKEGLERTVQIFKAVVQKLGKAD